MAVATIISLVVLAGLVGLLLWESQYECVRWSTRIEVRKSGKTHEVRVCAETRPRWGENIGK